MVALAAVVLFALQALLGTFAFAAGTGPSMVDAFGNPLCITHTEEQQPASAPGTDRSLAPDCCTLACGVATGFVPTDRAVAVLFNPLAQPSQRMFYGTAEPIGPAYDDLPGHPRGPPAAA